MKTFSDLVFKPVPHFRGNKKMKAEIHFNNGYGASVITEYYDEDEDEEYELAVLHNGHITTDTPITDDVLSGLSIYEVSKILKDIQNL